MTAHFASREEAHSAFSAAGLRILQIAEMRADERATDPVAVRMAADPVAPPREAHIRGLAFGAAR